MDDRWNIEFRYDYTREHVPVVDSQTTRTVPAGTWLPLWHMGETGKRTEAQAREEYTSMLKDPFWYNTRDIRLVNGAGEVMEEAIR